MRMMARLGLCVTLLGGFSIPLYSQIAAPAPATTTAPAQVFPKLPPDQPSPRLRTNGPDGGWLRRHQTNVDLAKKGDIDVYFLGDSITDFWSNPSSRGPSQGRRVWDYYYAPIKAVNFGISADNIEHVLYRVMNGEFDGVHPKVVVLLIGTNNFGHSPETTPEEDAGGIKHLIDVMHEKSPQTKFLLLGIFPRADATATRNNLMPKIKATNALLAKMDDGKTIRFLDIGDKFLAADGTLPRDVMPDSLHPSEKGYRIWAQAMNPTLFEMLGMPVPAVMPDAPAPATAPVTR